MAVIAMKSLLESGVHFGHRTHKWHPGMKPFIYTERNGIHIIDLQQTVKALEEAYKLIVDTVAEDGTVLFVGTKRQAQETIQMEAERCGMPYVTNRWLGGTLTNFRTIRQRINELERLERMRDRGDFSRITKKEALLLTRKMERLEYLIGGIRTLTTLPDLLFVVDVRREDTALHEANLLEIPVVALVDTNCDPRNVDYIIPSNDDAIRAIKLLVGKMADAALEGMALRKEERFEAAERMVTLPAEEVELSDEELLGEATLAKMEEAAAAQEAAVAEALARAEEAEEIEVKLDEAESEDEEAEEIEVELVEDESEDEEAEEIEVELDEDEFEDEEDELEDEEESGEDEDEFDEDDFDDEDDEEFDDDDYDEDEA